MNAFQNLHITPAAAEVMERAGMPRDLLAYKIGCHYLKLTREDKDLYAFQFNLIWPGIGMLHVFAVLAGDEESPPRTTVTTEEEHVRQTIDHIRAIGASRLSTAELDDIFGRSGRWQEIMDSLPEREAYLSIIGD